MGSSQSVGQVLPALPGSDRRRDQAPRAAGEGSFCAFGAILPKRISHALNAAPAAMNVRFFWEVSRQRRRTNLRQLPLVLDRAGDRFRAMPGALARRFATIP